MAKLNELKLRTQSIIRKQINNKTYLLWANEALEQLSEIAKVEVAPLELKSIGTDYQYIILDDGTHLHRFEITNYSTETIVYYDTNYNEIEKDWEDANETSTQDIIIGDIIYTYIILDVETSAGELVALKRTFSEDEKIYNYKNVDGTEYDEIIIEDDIKEILDVIDNTIDLPKDFQQIIKVVVIKNGYSYQFRERGFGDAEITTNSIYPNTSSGSVENNLFYVSLEESKLTLKSSLVKDNNYECYISYYAHLPQYDIVGDLKNWDNLTIPLEQTYHNLINYYCIYKYNESWKDNQTANDYLTKYLKLREEYREAVERKHQENMGSIAENTNPMV